MATTFIGGISSGPATSATVSAPLVTPGPIGSRLTPQQIARALGRTVKAPARPPKVRGPKGSRPVTNVYGITPPGVQRAPTGGVTGLGAPPAGAQAPAAPALPALDATAASNEVTNIFNVGQKTQGLTDQGSASTLAMQKALGGLAYQQPRDQLALEQAANRRGALYSSVYGQQAGDLVTNYANREIAARTADQTLQDSIAKQKLALQQGIPYYNWQQESASGARAIAAALANPATGQTPIPSTPQPKPPKGGGHYVNVNGQWTLIHAVGKNRWAPGPPPKKGK